MRERFSGSMVTVAVAGAAISAVISVSIPRTSAQAPAASVTATRPVLKTPWGEPDLQGIWTDETNTPLERPAKYTIQEFFTEAQRAELDKARVALAGKDKRAERGTEIDVTGSYNQVFLSRKRTGARTSLVVDPPNGQIPPLAFAEGRGPDPATRDSATAIDGFEEDPLRPQLTQLPLFARQIPFRSNS